MVNRTSRPQDPAVVVPQQWLSDWVMQMRAGLSELAIHTGLEKTRPASEFFADLRLRVKRDAAGSLLLDDAGAIRPGIKGMLERYAAFFHPHEERTIAHDLLFRLREIAKEEQP